MTEAFIENCQFAYRCPRRWTELEKILGYEDVKFCPACQRAVHWGATLEDLEVHARLGRCVAMPVGGVRAPDASLG